ncbi:MAG TPA: glycogen/starch synthase, partial [Nitrospiria bacterium]
MRILYAVSEVFPFSKTGGLADVAGALPVSLARLGHDVRVVAPELPMVRRGDRKFDSLGSVTVSLPNQSLNFTVIKSLLPDSPVEAFFLGNDGLFNRPGLYQENGRDYPDNHLRFGAFSRAVLALSGLTGWRPEIIHGNDWQTGLIFAYLKSDRGRPSPVPEAGTVFTVHNLGYQGVFPYKAFLELGLSPEL